MILFREFHDLEVEAADLAVMPQRVVTQGFQLADHGEQDVLAMASQLVPQPDEGGLQRRFGDLFYGAVVLALEVAPADLDSVVTS
jgi:hypothetical protein